MASVTINVRTPGPRPPSLGEPLGLRVTGTPSDLFLKSVEGAERESAGADARLWDLRGIEWDDPDFPVVLHQVAPAELTLGQAQEFFGDETKTWPPTIRVTEGGYGGGPEILRYALEFARNAEPYVTFVGGVLAAQRMVVRAWYSNARRLGKEWNDTGLIPQELKDVVYNGSPWVRRDFDRTFQLGPSRGPQLLRELGFERSGMSGHVEVWSYDFDRHDGNRG